MKLIKNFLFVFLMILYSCADSLYPDLEDGLYANIETNSGDILIKLEYDKVPVTVGNFVSLAEGNNKKVVDSLKGKPFYNGLKFHRVISLANGDGNNFMIQGGCPLGTGSGNPGYRFEDEFPKDANGQLLFKHDKPGAMSMANSGPATNGSQFFITIVPTPHLDGRHSVFGYVETGQNIVDSIQQDAKINKVEIVRVGRDAKRFDAFNSFNKSFEEADEVLRKSEDIQKETIYGFIKLKEKARELSPGFKIYIANNDDGVEPELETPIRISYSVYFTDGKLLDTNQKEVAKKYGVYDANRDKQGGYKPFSSTYSMNEGLIQGFKEGLQEMKFGDKAVLFIPYHLAYGEQGGRGIPPKSDLIFELEMFPVESK